jgi:hypothetical protein
MKPPIWNGDSFVPRLMGAIRLGRYSTQSYIYPNVDVVQIPGVINECEPRLAPSRQYQPYIQSDYDRAQTSHFSHNSGWFHSDLKIVVYNDSLR